MSDFNAPEEGHVDDTTTPDCADAVPDMAVVPVRHYPGRLSKQLAVCCIFDDSNAFVTIYATGRGVCSV